MGEENGGYLFKIQVDSVSWTRVQFTVAQPNIWKKYAAVIDEDWVIYIEVDQQPIRLKESFKSFISQDKGVSAYILDISDVVKNVNIGGKIRFFFHIVNRKVHITALLVTAQIAQN